MWLNEFPPWWQKKWCENSDRATLISRIQPAGLSLASSSSLQTLNFLKRITAEPLLLFSLHLPSFTLFILFYPVWITQISTVFITERFFVLFFLRMPPSQPRISPFSISGTFIRILVASCSANEGLNNFPGSNELSWLVDDFYSFISFLQASICGCVRGILGDKQNKREILIMKLKYYKKSLGIWKNNRHTKSDVGLHVLIKSTLNFK